VITFRASHLLILRIVGGESPRGGYKMISSLIQRLPLGIIQFYSFVLSRCWPLQPDGFLERRRRPVSPLNNPSTSLPETHFLPFLPLTFRSTTIPHAPDFPNSETHVFAIFVLLFSPCCAFLQSAFSPLCPIEKRPSSVNEL